jgi:beta-lactamase class A
MLFFGKRKKKEEEEQEDEDQIKPRRRRPIRDLSPENSRRRKTPPKPWGKKERIWILFVFATLAGSSAILAASARSWKLPNTPRLSTPKLSLEQTYVLENPNPRSTVKPSVGYDPLLQPLKTQISKLSGIYAFYIVDLESGQTFGMSENESLQAASLIKLPAMIALYQESEKGKLNLDEKYALKQSDKVGGSGSLYGRPEGEKISYRELLHLMGQQSDNTAFNIVRKKLGDDKIDQVATSIGMSSTSVGKNQTSAQDIGILFKKLWAGTLINQKDKEELLGFLTKTIYEDWIPASIGDDTVRVAHKYGREVHVINDAGIVYTKHPFVLVILTQGIVESEAGTALPVMIQEIYQYQLKMHS